MIAAWASSGLEVRRRHVVEQDVEVRREEFADALFQVRLGLRFQGQHPVERAVEAGVRHPFDRHAEEVPGALAWISHHRLLVVRNPPEP